MGLYVLSSLQLKLPLRAPIDVYPIFASSAGDPFSSERVLFCGAAEEMSQDVRTSDDECVSSTDGVFSVLAPRLRPPPSCRRVCTQPVWRNVSGARSGSCRFSTRIQASGLKTAYCCGGDYQPEALSEINHILRDFRANEIKPIDPQLLDLLHELGGTLETDQAFHIISGYRSPVTNAHAARTRRTQ